jgi:ribosomal protein S18 acetylase RimI-like enzyme
MTTMEANNRAGGHSTPARAMIAEMYRAESHLDGVAALLAATDFGGEPWPVDVWRDRIGRWALGVVFVDAGAVNGCVFAVCVEEGFTTRDIGLDALGCAPGDAYIGNLAVAESRRGRGFGRALVTGICGVVRKCGADNAICYALPRRWNFWHRCRWQQHGDSEVFTRRLA